MKLMKNLKQIHSIGANILQVVKRHHEIEEVDLIIETTLEDQQGDPMDFAVFNMVFLT